MPTRDTRAELALRREMHRLGLRYRTHAGNLPGSPDVALVRARIAVFVDGCFWHGCPEHGSTPKNNSAWWAAKLAANADRDRRKDAALVELGWLPVHVWEHDDPARAAAHIAALWSQRTGASHA